MSEPSTPSTSEMSQNLQQSQQQNDDVGDDDEEESCIIHWLTLSSLSYAIPNFQMAGIVTPRSFAELDVQYFESLGVTKAEDRKRLFYLVHKARGVIEEEDERKGKMRQQQQQRRGVVAGVEAEGTEGGAAAGEDCHNEDEDGDEDDDDEYGSEEFPSPSPSNAERLLLQGNNNNNNDYNLDEAAAARATKTKRGTKPMAIRTTTTKTTTTRPRSANQKEEYDDEYYDNDDMMSTVDVHGFHPSHEPISPVTISSPIASSLDGHHHHNGGGGGCNYGGGGGGERNFDFHRKAPPPPTAGAAASSSSAAPAPAPAPATATNAEERGSNQPRTREQLEKELELRALKRRQEKQLMMMMAQTKKKHEEKKDELGDYQEDNGLLFASDNDDDDGSMKKQKKKSSKQRRQSFLPSVAGSRSSRRSSISSYRTHSKQQQQQPAAAARSAAALNRKANDFKEGLDEIDRLLNDGTTTNNDSDDYKSSSLHQDILNDLDIDHHTATADAASIIATPKSLASSSSSVVDVRSRRTSGSIAGGVGSIHHRATVKKTNATRGRVGMSGGGGGAVTAKSATTMRSTTSGSVGSTSTASKARRKSRRYSNIPRATAAPLLENDNDDDDTNSIMSETSDLSTSVSSYRSSLGGGSFSSRSHSVASSTTRGGTISTAENYNGNIEKKRNTANSRLMASKLGKQQHSASGNSSIASKSSLRSTRTANTAGGRMGKKRLSTIPSSTIAPISPLAGLSSTQLDKSITAASSSSVSSRNPLRRRSSLGGTGTAGKKLGGGGGGGSSVSSSRPGSASSYPSRPSSRSSISLDGSSQARLRKKKLNTSATTPSSNKKGNPTSPSGMSSTSSVQRRRRIKSPVPCQSRPISPKRTQQQPPSSSTRPRSPLASSRGMSPTPRRNNHRSVSPKRTVGGGGGGRPLSPVRTRPLSPVRTNVRRPLSPIRSPARSRATSPKKASSSPRRVKSPIHNNSSNGNGGNGNTNGGVFVHGQAEDKSWATQIGQLRQSFDVEHEQYLENYNAANNDGNEDSDDDDEKQYEMRIRVIVRKRPMSQKESTDGLEVDVIHPLEYNSYGRILVHQPKTKLDLTKEIETSSFAFDNVFDEHSHNGLIYERAVQSLIPGVFRGKWASVFAYGQTGSGKTFTMMGSNATGMRAGNQAENNISNGQNLGLYFLAAQDVFRIAADPAYADITIGVSLFEIYGGKLLDLLNARHPVKCLEDRKGKVCFPGLSEHPVTNAEALMDIIDAGALNRSTGTTSANADSSRSHAVLQLSLRKDVGRAKNKEHGRLTFIDLAGSERGADTSKACRTTRMEGAEINTSLLALKEVIRALATGSSLKRIPFRGSKLTQVLKESFVGKNSRTVMVSCVAPNMKNCDHTLNTLRYADRVKERDAQTGKLSASVAANSQIKRDQADDIVRVKLPPRPLTAPAASFRIERDEDESSDDDDIPPPPSNEELLLHSLDEVTFVEEEEYVDNAEEKSGYSEFDYGKNVDSDENDSLEEALKSNDGHESTATISRPKALKDNPAAQTLVARHKSINTQLLQMLQLEMSLVNTHDSNRDNIEDYLKELENLSDQQLSLLSALRESLVSYNASKYTNGSSNTHTSTFNRLLDDSLDCSFDLRD